MPTLSLYQSGLKVSALSTLIAFSSTSIADADEQVPSEETIIRGKYLYSDEINALKTPTPILDVPQSLSIITSELIAERGYTNISDIINYIPGVNTSMGEGHRDSVVFRGIRSTADFYIDGNRDDVQYFRPLYNLEQVEILRGPNALLFGRGGTGGILNRVTKKSDVGESFNAYKFAVDSFGEYSIQLDSNYAVSDKTAFRLNAMYEDLASDRDFYDGERIGLNPTAKLVFNSATTLDLSYEYVDHERFLDRGIPTGADGKPVGELDDVVFGDPELNETRLEAHLFRATLQHEFSEQLKANANAFYGDYDKVYQNFYVSGYNNETATPNEVTLDGYVDSTIRENLILSGNLIAQFETGSIKHTLITGAEYIDTTSDQDRYNAFWDTTSDDNEVFSISRPLSLRGGVGVNALDETTTNDFSLDRNDATEVDLDVYAFYLQDEIELSDKFNIVLGARFESFDMYVDDVENAAEASRKDEEISPRAGIIYKPKENISLYASYSETYLPASGEQFANISDEDLSPDQFESQEIGQKWDFANLSLTFAYFENEETTSAKDNESGETFEERGLEVEGFEVQLEGQLTDKLFLRTGYSYLEGETGDGEQPRELPENMASIWANYKATDRLGFGLGASYQDESLITDGGSATLPSYTQVDTAAYYDISPSIRVQMNIENLLDEDYYPNSHSTHQVSVGEPVNVRLSLSGRF